MRGLLDKRRLKRLISALGRAAKGPGDVFLTGGACAVLMGWRGSTVDVDLRMDPEPPGVFAAIPKLKDQLDVNIELASPADFVPALPGWRDRSVSVGRHGAIHVWHYDFYGQALSKLERSHAQDLADVEAMVADRLVDPARLSDLFHAVEPELVRYPAVDADELAAKVAAFAEAHADG